MAEYKKPNPWIPFWIDKWLFGSTRIELLPDERSVWLDLLALASKNSGYIRANDTTPYPISQLAGLLIITEELLNRTIEKCIQYDKIIKNPDGTLKIPSWGTYQLSPRQKRRYSKTSKKASAKEDTVSKKKDAKNKRKKNKVNKKKEDISTFLKYFNEKTGKKYSLTPERKRIIEQRLKNHSLDQLKIAVDNFIKDDWSDRPKYTDIVYCIGIRNKVDNLERWLNFTPSQSETKSLITVEVARDMLARAAITDTMIDVLKRLPKEEYELFMKIVVNKDHYMRGLYQRAKKIMEKREGA